MRDRFRARSKSADNVAIMKKAAHRKPAAKPRKKRPAHQPAHRSAHPSSSAPSGRSSRARARTGHAGRVGGRPGYAQLGNSFSAALRSALPSWRTLAGVVTAPLSAGLAGGEARRQARSVAATTYSRDDREALALLLMPFLLLAAAISMSSGFKFERAVRSITAERASPHSPTAVPKLPPLAGEALRPVGPPSTIGLAGAAPVLVRAPAAGPVLAGEAAPVATALVQNDPMQTGPSPAEPSSRLAMVEPIAPAEAVRDALPEVASRVAGAVLGSVAGSAEGLPLSRPVAPDGTVAGGQSTPASVAVVSETPAGTQPRIGELASLDRFGLPDLTAIDGELPSDRPATPALGRCTVASLPAPIERPANLEPADFGRRLAVAALGQTGEFTIYNDAYRRISYPLGDVPKLYGVCTDVIIRAYREMGVDLQVAVQKSRVGSGDPSIDHRRTETLRRFFQRVGASLAVTPFAEDYLAGDIVTYDRPQNSGTRSHIAIVTDEMGPSGAPMIVHNRGWGPQLEDALFVDRITGHYRFAGGGAAQVAEGALQGATVPNAKRSGATGRGAHRPVVAPAKLRRPARASAPRHAASGATAGAGTGRALRSASASNSVSYAPAAGTTAQP